MTNQEMMDKQIADIAELFKGMFTKEELEELERKYDLLIESGSKDTKE